MDINLRLENFGKWFAAFHQSPQIAAQILGRSFRAILLFLSGRAAVYPPAPQDSTYQRTGTLGRLWTTATPQVNIGRNPIEARIGNATPYGPYVQSDEYQATIHKGRWKTLSQIIKEAEPGINDIMNQAGNELVRQIENQ